MSTDLYRALIEGTRRAVCVVDADGVVTYANPVAQACFGVRQGAALLHVVDIEHRGLLTSALERGEDAEFRLADRTRWVEADIVDLADVPGVDGLVIELRDTTSRRRMGERMTRDYLVEREAGAQLRELEELRAGLLAAVSHDFRTPLTSILGCGELLRDHWERFGDEERRDMIRRILRSSDQLDRRVAEFLDISRLDAGALELDVRDEDARDLVLAAVERTEMCFDGHEVVVQVPKGLLVRADAEATGRVLDNLLGNAAKYAPGGSIVRVTADWVEGFVRISVVDRGPGVAPEDRHRVFDAFVRTADGRRAARGAGVGLAVVRRLVEAQGGAVWIGDAPIGATFTVALPAVVTAEPEPLLLEALA